MNHISNTINNPFTRRNWLRLSASCLPILVAPALVAGESTGRWGDESKAEYSLKLIEWLRENFKTRSKQLEQHTGKPFHLDYKYLAPTEDRKKLRMLKKFKEGRLSRRASEKHVSECLTELERIRVALAMAESVAAQSWKPTSESYEVKQGSVFGTSVTAGRLTVILDNSRSMTPYLKKLRKEIAKDFPDAYIVEVNGCHLNREDNVPWFYSLPAYGINPFTPERHIPKVPMDSPYSKFIGWTRALPSAIDAMVDLMEADAIYWFCDFDDKDSDRVVKRLARKILAKKIKLYTHTVDHKPPPLISLLAKKSGGAAIKKRI